MLLGVLGWVFVGIFFVFSLLLASVATHETLAVVSKQPCVHQNLFIIDNFRFLVPMFFKVFENEIFGMKRFRSSVILVVYGHEMI